MVPGGPIAVALTAVSASTLGAAAVACGRANAFAAYALPVTADLDGAAGSVPAAEAAVPCRAPVSALGVDLPSAVVTLRVTPSGRPDPVPWPTAETTQ